VACFLPPLTARFLVAIERMPSARVSQVQVSGFAPLGGSYARARPVDGRRRTPPCPTSARKFIMLRSDTRPAPLPSRAILPSVPAPQPGLVHAFPTTWRRAIRQRREFPGRCAVCRPKTAGLQLLAPPAFMVGVCTWVRRGGPLPRFLDAGRPSCGDGVLYVDHRDSGASPGLQPPAGPPQLSLAPKCAWSAHPGADGQPDACQSGPCIDMASGLHRHHQQILLTQSPNDHHGPPAAWSWWSPTATDAARTIPAVREVGALHLANAAARPLSTAGWDGCS